MGWVSGAMFVDESLDGRLVWKNRLFRGGDEVSLPFPRGAGVDQLRPQTKQNFGGLCGAEPRHHLLQILPPVDAQALDHRVAGLLKQTGQMGAAVAAHTRVGRAYNAGLHGLSDHGAQGVPGIGTGVMRVAVHGAGKIFDDQPGLGKENCQLHVMAHVVMAGCDVQLQFGR